MPNKSDQKRRLFLMNSILLAETDENHSLTVYDLKSHLEVYGINVDRRTICGDIEDLITLGTDIVKEKDGKKDAYKVVQREFETAELKTMVDAVQASRFLTEKKSGELIRKISALTSVYEARKLRREVIIQGRDKYANEQVYYNVDRIHEALSLGRRICFEYYTWDVSRCLKLKGTYELSPWALIWSDEKYYVVGYDSMKRSRKHFRVDKMKKIVLSKAYRDGGFLFTREYLAKYTQRYFGMFDGDEKKIGLLIRSDKIGILFDHFGTGIPIWQEDDPDWVETEVRVVVSGQFFGWLHSLGDSIRLIRPEEVVEEYRDRLEKAIRDLG